MKYKANTDLAVNAWRIKGFRLDIRTFTNFVILEDGSEVRRPLVHGFRPSVNDYVIKTTIEQDLKNGAVYKEDKYYIVPKAEFERQYEPIEPPPAVPDLDNAIANFNATATGQSEPWKSRKKGEGVGGGSLWTAEDEAFATKMEKPE